MRTLAAFILSLLLLQPVLCAADNHGEPMQLPPVGSWAQYQIVLPARAPVDEAFLIEAPDLPPLRKPKQDDTSTKKQDAEKPDKQNATPSQEPDTFLVKIQLLAREGDTLDFLVEIGHGSHAIRQRVVGTRIPLLPEVMADLMHLPDKSKEMVKVGEQTIEAQVVSWQQDGQTVTLRRNAAIPFGVIGIEMEGFTMKLVAFHTAE